MFALVSSEVYSGIFNGIFNATDVSRCVRVMGGQLVTSAGEQRSFYNSNCDLRHVVYETGFAQEALDAVRGFYPKPLLRERVV